MYKPSELIRIKLVLVITAAVFLIIIFKSFLVNGIVQSPSAQKVKTPIPINAIGNIVNEDTEFTPPNVTISFSSKWIEPKEPEPILLAEDFRWSGVVAVKENKIWSEWKTFRDDLISQKLDKKYEQYFLSSALLPREHIVGDINNDGVEDNIFISIGVGCGSCHQNYIDFFVGDNNYRFHTNDGFVFIQNDNSGFYVLSARTGEDYSTCCSDNYLVRKYGWSGNGFNEIAQKTIQTKE